MKSSSAKAIKSVVQLELKLQAKMIVSLESQGWFATKTSDRFKAGRPDLRIARDDYGQMDVELKYNDLPIQYLVGDVAAHLEIDSGLTKLQWLKIKEMNEHGMPAIGLVYLAALDLFIVTTVLRETLPPVERRVPKLPGVEVISGPEMFITAARHLHALGYRHPRS